MIGSEGRLRTTRQEMWDILLGKIASEFCTPSGRRNSLEALGLVRVVYDSRKYKKLMSLATEYVPNKHREEVDALCHYLLENIRREKAIGNLYDLDMSDEFIWGKYSARTIRLSNA